LFFHPSCPCVWPVGEGQRASALKDILLSSGHLPFNFDNMEIDWIITMSQPSIVIQTVEKSFGSIRAVQGASFEVSPGEVFGLLGPNGAGKTTLIRLIMDIFKPDSGRVLLYDQPISDSGKNRIGYLPEERGLYTRQRIHSILEYFAALKGVTRSNAQINALYWLDRFDMKDVKNRRVQELSKGNQQKIQIIATLVSDPDILILDEPFTGLDPVNVRLISGIIRELADQGKTILLSTHQMALVETLCQRAFMIHHGHQVLYGSIEEIQKQYSDNAILVNSNADYGNCPLIAHVHPNGKSAKIFLKEGCSPREFLGWLLESGAEINSFEQATTPLEDIFIKLAEESR
jgi:ABC-2 type transport system ATP-binding protein